MDTLDSMNDDMMTSLVVSPPLWRAGMRREDHVTD